MKVDAHHLGEWVAVEEVRVVDRMMTMRDAESSFEAVYILVTFRRPGQFQAVMTALAQGLPPETGVCVVDNGGSGDTEAACEVLKQTGRPVWRLVPAENIGPAGATELAMTVLLQLLPDNAWIGRIDDDRAPRAQDLQEMLDFARDQLAADPAIGAVGMTGAVFDRRRAILSRPDLTGSPRAADVDFVATGHLALFRVAALRKAGVMWGDLFYGLTEVELGLRLRRSGFRVVVNAALWLRARTAAGKEGWRIRERSEPTSVLGWRRYYSTRNMAVLLRTLDAPLGAHLRASFRAVVSPMRLVGSVGPAGVLSAELLAIRALVDGYLFRLGKRVEPAQ